MKTDRELLLNAAKAAGIAGQYFDGTNLIHTGIYRAEHEYYWNPLISDSEALRLLVLLDMEFYIGEDEGKASYVGYWRKHPNMATRVYCIEYHDDLSHQGDVMSATRRAIVRAAAAIGENMA